MTAVPDDDLCAMAPAAGEEQDSGHVCEPIYCHLCEAHDYASAPPSVSSTADRDTLREQWIDHLVLHRVRGERLGMAEATRIADELLSLVPQPTTADDGLRQRVEALVAAPDSSSCYGATVSVSALRRALDVEQPPATCQSRHTDPDRALKMHCELAPHGDDVQHENHGTRW